MKSKIWIAALSLLAALTVFGCEEKTKYITREDTPETPLGVYSVTGDGYVDIYWQANNDGGLTDGYGIYRYSHTEGDQDVYVKIGTVNDGNIAYDPDSGVREGSYRDNNVSNGSTYYYAISAFNVFGESELSVRDAQDTPRPDGNSSMDLTAEDQNRLGWDFSQSRTRNWTSVDADVFFEYDSQNDAFFIWSNRDDVYLQSFGYTNSLKDVNWGEPGGGWNNVGWMQLVEGHAYLVGIGDVDQEGTSQNYGVVRITSLNTSTQEISFEWAYQTAQFNPELKQAPTNGEYPSAIRYYRRSGN